MKCQKEQTAIFSSLDDHREPVFCENLAGFCNMFKWVEKSGFLIHDIVLVILVGQMYNVAYHYLLQYSIDTPTSHINTIAVQCQTVPWHTLAQAQKPHCLLHDVLPQTFIGPPMTATFHIRILLTRGISFCVCCDPRTWFCIHCMISKLAHSSSYLVFQAVPVQRKLNFWQVFLMRCRQTWFTPSQIQHLPESMLFFHDLILPNIISCSHQISKSETSSVEKLPCSKTPINWFWNMSYIKYIRNTVICCRVKQKPLVPIQRVLGPLWSWFNLNSYVRQNIYP